MNIDKLAYISKLKDINPLEKMFFTFVNILVVLFMGDNIVSILMFLILSFLTIYIGKIPFKAYIRVFITPLSFLILGVLTIAINFSNDNSLFIKSIPLFGGFIGFTRIGSNMALKLFLKALGAVSSLYFLSLSTPMVDILSSLKKLRIPSLITELMELIYRFIFILSDTTNSILVAQNSRLGYIGLTRGIKSLGILISVLFMKAYKKSGDIYDSILSRGYEGELKVLEEVYEKKPINYFFAILFNGLIIVISILARRI